MKTLPITIALLSLTTTSILAQNPPVQYPNIIFCMADDLGWGDVGYNGNTDIKTPNLDEMAREGVRFNRFYAGSSVCSPTRGSCLTGRHPYRYGIFSANDGHLKDKEICLAEVLKEKGYATAHFGKWHLGTLTADFSGKGEKREPEKNFMTPGMQGFDEWFSTEYAIPTYNPYSIVDNGRGDVRALYWENGVNITGGLSGDDSKIIMDKAIPFIQKNANAQTPFFAVIWFHAAHEPVVGDPEVMKKYYSGFSEDQQHYYSVVTSLDAQMGRLRKELKELGIAENTMLCFTSDNGPEGNPDKKGHSQGSAGPFRGRKRSLYEGGVREPGIIEYPKVFGTGKVIETSASTSDYFPTVCDLLGYKVKADRPYDGISLLPIINGSQQLRDHPIGFQWGEQKSLTDDRYKLVQNLAPDRHRSDNGTVPLAEYELYDLISNPYETQNIADQHPEIVEKMKKQLDKWVTSCESSLDGKDYKK